MRKAFIQLHIAVWLAGFTAVLGKFIHLHELILVLYRMAATALVLALFMWWQRSWVPVTRKTAGQLTGTGAIIAFHWLCFYGSIRYANISVALTCFAATGFFTAIFEPLILKRKPVLAELLLGLLALAGIGIIFNFHPQFKTGIIFGLLAAMGSGLFPIFNKQLIRHTNHRTLVFYEMCGGTVFLLLLLPLYLRQFPATYYLPTLQDSAGLLVLVIFCTVLSFELQLAALQKISAFTVNLTYNLEPVYGILLAFLFFGENKNLQPGFYSGLALILISIALQTYRVWKTPAYR